MRHLHIISNGIPKLAEGDNGGSYWSNMFYGLGILLNGLSALFGSILNSAFVVNKGAEN